MKSITLFASILISSLSFVQAQNEISEKKLSFEGSIDVYYQTDLTSSDQAIFGENNDQFQNFGTSFVNKTGFALGMVNLIAKYNMDKTGAIADLVFGPRGEAAIGGYNINQLYVYWNINKNTTLTLGRFNTYLGYEVISPTGNFNYSTSYLFSSGPFSHVGLKADFKLSKDFNLMLAIMNPTDMNNNAVAGYALGTQIAYSNHYLNFYYDDKEILGFEIDYTGGFDLTNKFFLGVNTSYANNEGEGFIGAAIYPEFKTSESFSIGLRAEYFDWISQTNTLVDNLNVISLTLTGNYTVENLTLKPEIRFDNNSEPVFMDNDFSESKSLSAFLVAAVYKFNY